ncbi:hypothetical protein GCM10027262_78620 [Nocardia tengchongensis]
MEHERIRHRIGQRSEPDLVQIGHILTRHHSTSGHRAPPPSQIPPGSQPPPTRTETADQRHPKAVTLPVITPTEDTQNGSMVGVSRPRYDFRGRGKVVNLGKYVSYGAYEQ